MYWRIRKTPKADARFGANPASALKKTTAAVTTEATMAEFASAVQKLTLTSPESNRRRRLCQSSPPGVTTGGYAETAELPCEATTSDQYSGRTDSSAASARRRYVIGPAAPSRRESRWRLRTRARWATAAIRT